MSVDESLDAANITAVLSFWLVGETGSDELMMDNRAFRDS